MQSNSCTLDSHRRHGSTMTRNDSGFGVSDSHPDRAPVLLRSGLSEKQHSGIVLLEGLESRNMHTSSPKKTSQSAVAFPNRRSMSRSTSFETSSGDSGPRSRKSRHSSTRSPRSACRISNAHHGSRPSSSQKLRHTASMMPLPTRDIDDVLALHYRSCSLFQTANFRAQSQPMAADNEGAQMSWSLPAHQSNENLTISTVPTPEPFCNSICEVRPSTSTGYTHQVHESHHIRPTTIHWNSLSTRRRQYEEIDRSARGIRGLWRRMVPRRFSSPAPRFYDPQKPSDSDAGSVRRYRVILPGDEEDAIEEERADGSLDDQAKEKEDEDEEKQRTESRAKDSRSLPGRSRSPRKGWSCF